MIQVWPAPWKWRKVRALETRRAAWFVKFFTEDIAAVPEVVRRCELESRPSTLMVEPVDALHEETIRKLTGAWIAVKVAARLLPSDPVQAAVGILEATERDIESLRSQVDHVRPVASGRAPDGGRWHPWVLNHPESGVTLEEAAKRDMEAGGAEAYVEHADAGVLTFRRHLRRAFLLSGIVRILPLLLLAIAVAVAESYVSGRSMWLVVITAIVVFIAVDLLMIDRLIEPLIDGRRRRILDEAAANYEPLGSAALASALSRRNGVGPEAD